MLHRRSLTTKGCISFQTNSSPGRIFGTTSHRASLHPEAARRARQGAGIKQSNLLVTQGVRSSARLQMGFPERFHSFSPPPQVQRSPFKALLPGPAGAGHLDQARQQQEFLWQRISPRMTRNERCRFNSSCAFSGHGLQEGGTGPSPVRPGRRSEAPVSEAVPGRLKGDERDLLHSPGWPGHAARLRAAQPRGRRPLTSPQRRRPLHSPSARRRPLHPPPPPAATTTTTSSARRLSGERAAGPRPHPLFPRPVSLPRFSPRAPPAGPAHSSPAERRRAGGAGRPVGAGQPLLSPPP